MSDDEVREAGRIVARRRPGPVTDPAILAKVAALVVGTGGTGPRGAPSGHLAGLDAVRVATGNEQVPAGVAPQSKQKS